MIFEIDKSTTKYTDQAKIVLSYGNTVATNLIELFIMSKTSVFGIDGYTMQDARALFDAMELISPGSTVKCFQLHAAFGEFIAATNPGALTEEQLSSPVPYEIEMTENGPVVRLLGDKYPTEETTDEV